MNGVVDSGDSDGSGSSDAEGGDGAEKMDAAGSSGLLCSCFTFVLRFCLLSFQFDFVSHFELIEQREVKTRRSSFIEAQESLDSRSSPERPRSPMRSRRH